VTREAAMKSDRVPCRLVGEDGNVFAILGRASKALKLAGRPEQSKEMFERVQACKSYDEALSIVQEYVRDAG